MFKFKWVKYENTGGGTITYFGQLTDGRYFIATDFEDVAIVDSDPNEWYEGRIDESKWFDEHYVSGISYWEDEWVDFFYALYEYALSHTNGVSTMEIRRVKNYYDAFLKEIENSYEDITESKSIKRPSIMASKNSWKFVNVSPDYTGGGIYVYTGKLSDGTYFFADGDNYYAEILDSDPRDDYEEAFYPEWLDEHIIRSVVDEEALDFFESMLKWVIKNKPHDEFCNYSLYEMEKALDMLKSYRKTGHRF